MYDLIKAGEGAKKAAQILATAGTDLKNNALCAIADAIVEKTDFILNENKKDLLSAEENGVRKAMIDRLSLNEKRIADIADGVRKVAELPDPIGEVLGMVKRPNGLVIGKKRVPLGVIGIIYEARPNVTADAAALCIKSGNAVMLRGGKEAICSNLALAKVMSEAGEKAGLPAGTINLVSDTSRETASAMMKLNGYIDVLIPRGGAGLIHSVVQNATVPVIETGLGNCHTYIDESADIKMAEEIVINAKVSRPSVCNAMETLLVHEKIAGEFLPQIIKKLKECNVEVRGCEKTMSVVKDIVPATQTDWETEYNDYILAVKVVSSTDEAIAHINKYGTKHSEAIVTKSYEMSQKFLDEIDAAAVYVNASTRFTDGFEFGFGAEIGISTQKIHARGPMGLNELTTIKYIIYGNGQIR